MMKNIPFWGQLLIVIAVGAAVVFVGYKFWLAEDYQKIGELRSQLAAKKQQIRQEQDIVAKLPQLEAELARLRQTLADLKEILPTEPESGELLKWIKNLADQSNLDLKDFTPEALRQVEFYKEYPDQDEHRGRLPRSRAVPRPDQQVLPDHQRQQREHPGHPRRRGEDDPVGLHGHDLHLQRGGGESRRGRRRGDMMAIRRLLILAFLAAPLALAAPAALAADPPAGEKRAPPAGTPAAGAPAAGGELQSTAQQQGAAVVEQVLKDKEDLITGKRFTYDPGGRRDPFRSLLEQVSRFKGPRPKGIAGMLIGEVDLVGTVKDPKGNLAFFKGSDGKGYFLHVGEEVYDGRIIDIDPAAGTVTFRQRVDDPRQIKPYRDITKRLTPLTEEEAQ